MKGLCTVASGEVCTLSIKSGDLPEVGAYYVIEKIVDKGTAKQNRTFHPLIDCLYSWMLDINTFQFEDNGIEYDLRCSNKDKLKLLFKIRYGKGACLWRYSDKNHNLVEIDDLNKVPDYVVDDFNKGNKGRINASDAISWKYYDKKDRIELIDKTINIMKTIGVDSKKFYDVLDGIKH